MFKTLTNSTRGGVKWKGVCSVIGGILVLLTLGSIYTTGNMIPYISSYLRKKGQDPFMTNTKCSWILATQVMGMAASMFAGGIIEAKIGPRLTALLGGWFMSLGVALTYFSIQYSFPMTLFTNGLMVGLGVGVGYAVPISCAVKWFPHNSGLVSGFIVAGFGASAVIFNIVQTAYINPDNLTPDIRDEMQDYFNQDRVLDSVPNIFLITGACYAVMQLIGSMLLSYPSATESVQEICEESDNPINETNTDVKETTFIRHTTNHSSQSSHSRNTGVQSYDYTPGQMLRTRYFYVLFFTFLFSGQCVIFVSSLYKAFGQTFISDDEFLSLVGTFGSLFNGLGRIFWGFVLDRTSFRVASICIASSSAVLLMTMPTVTKLGGKPVFMIYACLLFGTSNTIFTIFPAVTAKRFGKKHMTTNYGLVFLNELFIAVLAVFLNQELLPVMGWTGLFYLSAGCSCCSLLLTMVFSEKNGEGKYF